MTFHWLLEGSDCCACRLWSRTITGFCAGAPSARTKCEAVVFANVRDLQTALAYAGKTVKVVRLGHDTNSEGEAAYSIRGQLCAFSGDTTQDDEDLSKAEDLLAKVLTKEFSSVIGNSTDLLDRMHRPKEAQAKRDEAATI